MNKYFTSVLKKLKFSTPARDSYRQLKKIHWELSQIRKIQHASLNLAHRQSAAELRAFYEKQKLGYIETLEHIKKHQKSFTRFGDGEISLMILPNYSLRFQTNSDALSKSLRTVFYCQGYDPEKLLIGLPEQFSGDLHWDTVWPNIFPSFVPLFLSGLTYGEAHVSRPIAFQRHEGRILKAWRDVWQDKRAVFIYGENSRFEKLDALFSNVRDDSFDIQSAPINAFEKLPELIKSVQDRCEVDDILLVSLGPAATVLCAELSNLGYQAIDIGHLASSYLNAVSNGAHPEQLQLTKS